MDGPGVPKLLLLLASELFPEDGGVHEAYCMNRGYYVFPRRSSGVWEKNGRDGQSGGGVQWFNDSMVQWESGKKWWQR